jgi:hypothetical protein
MVMSLLTEVVPGAAQAAALASSLSYHDLTLPVSFTLPSCAVTLIDAGSNHDRSNATMMLFLISAVLGLGLMQTWQFPWFDVQLKRSHSEGFSPMREHDSESTSTGQTFPKQGIAPRPVAVVVILASALSLGFSWRFYCGTALFEGGVIAIAVGAASIERFLTHEAVERCVQLKALNQVRIGHEQSSKRDQVGAAAGHCFHRHLPVIAVVDHPDAVETVMQGGVIESNTVPRPAGLAFHDMHIGQTKVIEAFDDLIEEPLRMAVP